MERKLVSYIFPAFNEVETLPELSKVLQPILIEVEKKYRTEIIFINDGSKDNTLGLLNEMASKDKRIRILNFSRNFGHQIAISAGLDFAEGDAVIIMDVDLQDPPTVSLDLLKKWEEGFQVVYAQRRSRKDGFFKRITAFGFYRVLSAFADIDIPKDTGDFRLMDKVVVQEIRKYKEHNRFMRGLVSYLGFRQTGVLFDRANRFAGATHYPLKKMLKLANDAIVSFSYAPLRIVNRLGYVLMAISSLAVLVWLLAKVFAWNVHYPTSVDVLIVGAFLTGINLAALGILGQYLGRIYSEVQDRPLYILNPVE